MLRPMALRVVLLDCDGVLIRSERANLAYYNHLFEVFALPQVALEDREPMHLLHTLSTPQVVEHFFPAALREQALSYAVGVDFSLFAGLLEAEPGWDRVLPRLRGLFSVGVATNRGASARTVLGGVGLLSCVDFIVTIRDVERPKPHPDLLLKALENSGARPTEAVYVGDSDLDRQAALGAGVPFLGFRDGRPGQARSPEEVEQRVLRIAANTVSASMKSAEP